MASTTVTEVILDQLSTAGKTVRELVDYVHEVARPRIRRLSPKVPRPAVKKKLRILRREHRVEKCKDGRYLLSSSPEMILEAFSTEDLSQLGNTSLLDFVRQKHPGSVLSDTWLSSVPPHLSDNWSDAFSMAMKEKGLSVDDIQLLISLQHPDVIISTSRKALNDTLAWMKKNGEIVLCKGRRYKLVA